MNITIKFNDNIKHQYNSFDDIIKLDNYDDITYIGLKNVIPFKLPYRLPKILKQLYSSHNNLTIIPPLPNTLTLLICRHNNLSKLPKLPNSLTHLDCRHNNLSKLPKLPNSLTRLDCCHNKLINLGNRIPKNIKFLDYYHNELVTLPLGINKISKLKYVDNPVCMDIFYPDPLKLYLLKKRTEINIANKIGNWFLECKYNPKYKYCRDRLKKEHTIIFDN